MSQSWMRVCLVTTVLALGMATAAPRKAIPPPPRHTGAHGDPAAIKEIARKLIEWSEKDDVSPWEMSGQFEGDIMLPDDSTARNVILNQTLLWPGGVLPYYIKEEDFTKEDVDAIRNAIKEFRKVSCVELREYREGDKDFVSVTGNYSGCWSYVGRMPGGQYLNLQPDGGCLKSGPVQHEFLHALGFFHQQSAPNRDDYVKINWENIEDGEDYNFEKYNRSVVTDYRIEYDYGSLMHYGRNAFSRNGKPTIEPLDKNATIGESETISEKDFQKLELTYGCKKD